MLVIGEIVKAQGILGELKIRPLTNDVERFKKLRAAYIDTALYQIANIRVYNGFVYAKLGLVDSRDKAELLVGKKVSIDRVHAVATEEGEYFIADLIGCDFIIDGKKEGKITYIYQNGAADVFEVLLKDGKTIMFPFLKKLNLVVDQNSKEVSIKGEDLWKVALVND